MTGLWGTLGCSASTPGELVRPDDISAKEAMDEDEGDPVACREVGSRDTPLIVDMKASDRADLEAVMREGVGVVAYDCETIKILPDCRLDGDYRFVAVSKKEETVQLSNADDVAANLPITGSVLVKAGYGRKSSIDLATVLVGKHATTVREGKAKDGADACKGATHFIRGAYVGAFAVKTGTIGKIESAVKIFEAGASGSSTSEKNVDKRDGDPKACDQLELDDDKPPAACSALVRLELVALGAEPVAAPAPDQPPPDEPATCPNGMVWTGSVCTKDTGEPHVCAPDDVPDCKLQCERGNQESCAHYGVELLKGQKVAPDPPKGKTLLEGACSAGIGKACNGLGVINAKGLVGAKDLPKAMKFYEQACEQGYMNACFNVAYAHDIGQGVPVDQDSAALYYVRSCAGGVGLGCMNLGIKLIEKKGHEAEGAALLARGCSGGVGHACHNLALAHQRGEGVPKDETRAKTLYRQACDMGHAPACGFAN